MNGLIKYIFLLLNSMGSNYLLSQFPMPVYVGEKLDNEDVMILHKDTNIQREVVAFNPHPTNTSSAFARPFVKIIEPSLIHLITQREMLLDEINYYDVEHIKTNKIKSMTLLLIHSKRVTGEDSVGIKEVYDYDTTGNVLKYELKSLKDKDSYINEFLYRDGKLNQVIRTAYTEYNDTKTIDTFSVVTDSKNNISKITPLSTISNRCLASYSLEYDTHNKLKSIMRTIDCRIIDTTWTRFNRDHYGRVVDMSYGKCGQRFFARDDNRRVSEVVEIDCYETNHHTLFVSTRTYDKEGNLNSTYTDVHELGDDVHYDQRIYLKHGVAGVVESFEKQSGKLHSTTKVTYEFF